LVIGLTQASAQSQTDPLISAQAADVLSNLITLTSQKADARVEAMHQYLAQIGKDEAFSQAKAPPKEKGIFFNDLFKGAVLFIKNGGVKYANPALEQMNGEQLTNEFNELQVYNIQTFLHVVEQKHAVDSMEAFLKGGGNLEGYQKWAKEHGIATQRPAAITPQEVPARMEEMIKSAKATEWAKAEARGMSQEEFEKEWKQRVEKYRESVAREVDGCKQLAKSLSAPPPPAPAPPPLPPSGGAFNPKQELKPPAPLAPPVQSRYTPEYFQAKNKELWDRFDY
jgi:hypothetical protein